MSTIHILLVDDEKRLVLGLSKLLTARGVTVSTAFSGREALALLSGKPGVDVAVLDVRMPDMSGIETLERIKQNRPDIQVIMLTGHATVDDGIQAVRKGAFDYLQKPCDIEDLLAKIALAYRVGHIRRHPVLWPRTRAGEAILSGFIPLLPEAPLTAALEIFRRYREGEGARVLFVADDRGHIQGEIGKRDMIHAAEAQHPGETVTWEWIRSHPNRLPKLPVGRVMRREVQTVSPDTGLEDTAHRMLMHRYNSMPVVTGEGILLGVIRLRDVLRYLDAARDGNEDTAWDLQPPEETPETPP